MGSLTWRWRLISAIVAGLVGALRWRIDIEGLEHVAEADGAVLAFNHHSYVDFAMIGWGIVRELDRPIRYLAKREMWETGLTRWLVRLGGAVPVGRGDAESRRGAYEAAVGALYDGELVAVAPEQTISESFELLPLSTGVVRMAQQAGVPIIPTIGWGTQRFVTKGRRMHLAVGIPVLVRYGEPLWVDPDEDPQLATDWLRQRMGAMLDTAQRSYPEHPAPGRGWWLPARLGGSAPPHQEALKAHRERVRLWRSDDRDERAGDEDGDEEPSAGAQS